MSKDKNLDLSEYIDICDNASDLIQSVTPDGYFRFVNKAWLKSLGYKKNEISKLAIFDIIHPDELEHCKDLFARVMSGDDIGLVTTVFVTKTGQSIFVEGNVNCDFVNGKPTYTRAIFRDITIRKEIEKSLSMLEQNFRNSVDNSPFGIRIVDPQGNLVYANRAMLDLYGYENIEEMQNTPISKRLTPESYATYIERGKDVLNGKPIPDEQEIEIVRKDGEIRNLYAIRREVIWDGEKQYQYICQDITERKLLEKELDGKNERHQTIVEQAADSIVLVDTETGELVEFNDKAYENLGYSREEFAQLKIPDFEITESEEEVTKHIEKIIRDGSDSFETKHRKVNGEIRDIQVSSRLLPIKGRNYIQSVWRDITELKQIEKERERMYESEKELRQNLEDELKRRAEFSRTLVHELKTPLTPIIAASELLLDEAQEGILQKLALSINRSANTMSKRVDTLLDLARGELGVLELEYSEINPLVLLHKIANEMSLVAEGRELSLVLYVPSSLPVLRGDESRLEQVIQNLVTNAFKWSSPGGSVTIKAKEQNTSLIIEVQDEGTGISKNAQARIFDAYYRTEDDRQQIEGLGLGLALCKTIIEAHNGNIWVESEVGKGSTFSFSLPL